MLDSIDEQGNITWHCDNPKCSHHNCASWDFRVCSSHAQQGAVQGETHQHHISHEGIQWQDERHVTLPQCHCGQNHTLVTSWTEEELLPPIITRGTHPITKQENAILGVNVLGANNFVRVVQHLERHIVNGEPTIIDVIDDVVIHPAIARHQELARQLINTGKTPPAL